MSRLRREPYIPPGITRAACPFVFKCNRCKSFTEYDSEHERYSCQNSECDSFNKMKRPEDIDFGEYYTNPITEDAQEDAE